MDVVTMPVTALIPYEFNNRTHPESQVDRIANSIKSFGFNQPIVVDESNVILVGHGRWLAAQKLGLKDTPVLKKTGLTETQKRAYRILDNKLQNDSAWEFNNLELELGALEDEGFNLEEWGLDELQGLFPENDPEVHEDEGPGELPSETYIKRGDLIELGRHRVLCGDSTAPEDVSELLGGEAPVLMVTDAPYGVEYDPEWREGEDLGVGKRSTGKVTNDDRYDWSETLQLFNVPVLYYWYASALTPEVCNSVLKSGYKIVSQIIWVKQHFALSRGDYHWQHEPCLYAVVEGENHNWQGARDQSSVWEIKNNNSFGNSEKEETFGHGTQKPIECMARPIRNNSRKGDLIVDPFLGSGTTLIAADQLGRTCYGMEIEPKYCQVIIDRYQRYCEKAGKPFECKINGEPSSG